MRKHALPIASKVWTPCYTSSSTHMLQFVLWREATEGPSIKIQDYGDFAMDPRWFDKFDIIQVWIVLASVWCLKASSACIPHRTDQSVLPNTQRSLLLHAISWGSQPYFLALNEWAFSLVHVGELAPKRGISLRDTRTCCRYPREASGW